MKIFYLAHPVTADSQMSYTANLRSAMMYQETLYEAGIISVIPWYSQCLHHSLYGRYGGLRDKMLAIDVDMVRRCDGIVLCGHKISAGMQIELDAARFAGKEVIDLVGRPRDSLLAYLMFAKEQAGNATREPEQPTRGGLHHQGTDPGAVKRTDLE